jgi:hypothetical protein
VVTWIITNFSRINRTKHYLDVFVIGAYKWWALSLHLLQDATVEWFLNILSWYISGLLWCRCVLLFPKGNKVGHLLM